MSTLGVLLPNGNVVAFVSACIYQYDPVTNLSGVTNLTNLVFSGCVLDQTGNVICIPTGNQVGVYNPTTRVLTPITIPDSGFSGGTLLPSGLVAFFPSSASNIGLFNPIKLTYSSVPASTVGYASGTLIPSGQVILAPFTTTTIGIIETFVPSSIEICLSPYFNK